MTRRQLLLASFLIVLISGFALPAAAHAAGKVEPLGVTYYYLPG